MALTREYHNRRQRQGAYRYRLGRRTREVLTAINEFGEGQTKRILDIGTADGLMLEHLSESFDAAFVGLDVSFELLTANPNRSFHALQADALTLPFHQGIFDVVIATAVIEHIRDEISFFSECQRVLRKGGLFILTTPDPLFDRISELIGHTEKGQHIKRCSLSKLKSLCQSCGLRVLKAHKFMISPIGFPYGITIEKIMKVIRLESFLLNQLVVAQK